MNLSKIARVRNFAVLNYWLSIINCAGIFSAVLRNLKKYLTIDRYQICVKSRMKSCGE